MQKKSKTIASPTYVADVCFAGPYGTTSMPCENAFKDTEFAAFAKAAKKSK